MEKFVASSSDAVISGLALYPAFLGMLHGEYAHILDEFGVDVDNLEEWYSQQFVLDIYKRIAQEVSNDLVLVSVGLQLAGEAPPEFDGLEEYLEYLADIYEASSEDLGEGDTLYAEKIADKHYEVINATPMPDDLIYGFLYGNAKRYAQSFTVIYCAPEDVNSSDNMHYQIQWD